jgi:predicted MPP superfamily phosphohydrolase
MSPDLFEKLEQRLGRLHARQRLGIERDHEAHVFTRGRRFFHIENWYSLHAVIRNCLKLSGLYWRGQRNAARLRLNRNKIAFPNLPPAFENFVILHISDMHVDISEPAMTHLIELARDLDYDLCVMTGDFRGGTFGSFEATLEGLARVCAHLKGPVYGILGNHDSILMLPGMEEIGIRMLINEAETIEREGQRLHLVGIDDAHFYRVDNIEKAASEVPHDDFSILLSHTPEVYRHAAHAGFDLLLCGHTHGGQICLPGSIPVTLDAAMPRRFGAGAWRYHEMIGYTSVGAGSSIVPVRLNCRPEITLHHLERS